MTIFGKILLGLILATAAVLLIKGANGTPNEEVAEEPTAEEVSEATPTTEDSASAEFRGSLATLIARGGNYKCAFKQDTEVGSSVGTVYISGNEMRGDFSSLVTAANMTVESHMISDGEYMYTWSDVMPTGMKVKIDATATAPSSSQGFDANQELDYKCDLWTRDGTVFKLPEGTTFTEIQTS